MTSRIPTRMRIAAVLASTLALAAGGASVAVAAPGAPGRPTTSLSSPTNAATATYSWPAATPDAAGGPVRYEGGIGRRAAPVAPAPFGEGTAAEVQFAGDGSQSFFVRAVQDALDGSGPMVSDYVQSSAITVDRTPPSITVALVPGAPNGLAGWYTAQGSGLTIRPRCSDALSTVIGCTDVGWLTLAGSVTRAQARTPTTASITVRDAAGNQATGTSPMFRYDGIAPEPKPLIAPAPNALVTTPPNFSWRRFDDGTSGTAYYEILYRTGGRAGQYEPTPLARVGQAGRGETIVTVTPARFGVSLPINADIWWAVRTADAAGNVSLTSERRFRLDPTAPPAPRLVAGPSGPTRERTPRFAWTGTSGVFAWDVTRAGEDEPVQTGAGPASEVTLQPLTDGDYVFRVRQSGALVMSADAYQAFEVDTVAPSAPVILQRPGAAPGPSATYAWSTEIGAVGRWSVASPGGSVLRGPSDAPNGTVTLAGLASGSYDFRLQAVDGAGNESPTTVERFGVSSTPARALPSGRRAALPTLRAKRLKPRAGATLYTRRPSLHWKRGPKGTRMYNVQIFIATNRSGSRPATVRKVLSLFPRGTSLTLRKRLSAGACFVWRVWPHNGRRFTPQPIGVSNFCIADAKAIRVRAKRR